MEKHVERIGDLLARKGIVTQDDSEHAAQAARALHRPIGEVFVTQFAVEERELYRGLAEQRGLKFATSDELKRIADPALARAIPRRFELYNHVLPIARAGRRVVVATCDPLAHVPELARALEAEELELRVVTPTDFRRLASSFALSQEPVESVVEPEPEPETESLDDPEVRQGSIAFLDTIILDAVGERASDIHLEVYGNRVRVRIRVDGDLRDLTHFKPSPIQLQSIVNVAKVRARLDIAERSAPQGGRFSTKVAGKVFDVRAQTQPTLYGEHLVLRLLPQEEHPLDISGLGFTPELAKLYRRLLDSPGGVVLVVGPTGSGKSTTLYAGLQVLAHDNTRKVITIEDPIEYAIENVQQSQVLPEVGFTFATAMRAFVREDPDVILVGEIRDGETALEAMRASQTGHLVLSTLHCNDTVDAVQRLLDLGMHRNTVGSELLAVIAQRLAKRICEGCGVETTPDAELLAEVFPSGVPDGMKFFKGAGCERCQGFGTHGRIAVAEFLNAGPVLRRGISRQLPLDELRTVAREAGLLPLRTQALYLVKEGVIALTELRDMIPPDLIGGR